MNKENIYTDKDDNIKKDVNPGNAEEFMSEESYIQSQIESP